MSKERILIVDDDPDIVETVAFFLSNSGYQVLAAKDGKEALELVENKPDLVFLDIMMPEMNGLEACRKLKNNPKTNSIPVVMLTAQGGKQDVDDAIDGGANGYVVKPFNLPDLVERIETILNAKGFFKE